MQKLNLPDCELKLKSEEGINYVFDIVRKKWIVLTPEEWVRQHFIHLMINQLAYPRSLMKVESGLSYFKSVKRSDITVLDKSGKTFMMVECKAPTVKIGREALNQVSVYNKPIEAQYIAITNGLKHYCWKYEAAEYLQLPHFPKFED